MLSPIEKDDGSEIELSLPDSFDDSLCLDLYKDVIEKTRRETSSRISDNDDEKDQVQLKDKVGYVSLEKRRAATEAKDEIIKSQLQKHMTLVVSSTVREKELECQVLEYKRKFHLMGLDLEHARKESEAFLKRAEKSEKNREISISALKMSQERHEKDLSRINTEHEETKSRYECEIIRLRDEVVFTRNQQDQAFGRESKLWCDARDQAIEQVKLLHHELSVLRSDKETKEAETSDIIIELERQLADVRSDLKVKSCELNTLQVSRDRTIAEVTKSKDESHKFREALSQLQKECSQLERRADRLEESVRLKDEELKVYRHDDLLVGCGIEDAPSNDENNVSGRSALVKNSVQLARKCRELQSTLKIMGEELSSEREKNGVLSRREESNQRLFHEMSSKSNKTASTYIISTLKGRDEKIIKLQTNLNRTVEERDELSASLKRVLQRREELDEMKKLVESMRNAMLSQRDCDQRTAAVVHGGADEGPNYLDDEDEDLFEHLIHRTYMTLPRSRSN